MIAKYFDSHDEIDQKVLLGDSGHLFIVFIFF